MDWWVRAAMVDDSLAAQMLVGMSMDRSPPKWLRRRPRSRSMARSGFKKPKEEEEEARASPTTPLSWSAGSSPSSASGGADDPSQSQKRLSDAETRAGPCDKGKSKIDTSEEGMSILTSRMTKRKLDMECKTSTERAALPCPSMRGVVFRVPDLNELPDLNEMPDLEDDSCNEILYGIS